MLRSPFMWDGSCGDGGPIARNSARPLPSDEASDFVLALTKPDPDQRLDHGPNLGLSRFLLCCGFVACPIELLFFAGGLAKAKSGRPDSCQH